MIYRFRNLKSIEDRNFEADDLISALNQVSREWFDGSEVVDFQRDSSSRITLLSRQGNGNVIGRVYLWD